jgi:hypothetical protein
VFLTAQFGTACRDTRYTWAFAQDHDGSVAPGEFCRETLADGIYDDANRGRLRQDAGSSIWLSGGQSGSYRIVAFSTREQCEAALRSVRLASHP